MRRISRPYDFYLSKSIDCPARNDEATSVPGAAAVSAGARVTSVAMVIANFGLTLTISSS